MNKEELNKEIQNKEQIKEDNQEKKNLNNNEDKKENLDNVNNEKKSCQDEIETLKNKNIFLLAEMENLRKIHSKEKSELVKYFLSSFLQKLLPSLEMFELALNSKNVSGEIKNWLLGFEMINKNIKNILEEFGVKKIEVKKGDQFNPRFHESIEEKESDEIEKGKILEIKQNGYVLNDRLIKATSVILSSGKKQI